MKQQKVTKGNKRVHSKFNTVTETNWRHIGLHSTLPATHPVSLILAAAGLGVEG